MKKLIGIILVLVLAIGAVFALTACGPKEFEIAMITDVGTVEDKSFNQTTYEGVKSWAEENGKTYKYYKPANDAGQNPSKTQILDAVDLAVANGAKVIVTAGFIFETPLKDAVKKYPAVNFVLLDGGLGDDQTDNIASFTYTVEEAGWLAGYAAVKEGYTSLAYVGGMPFPTVYNAGHGFVQGADAAAKEMNVDITIKYGHTGNFDDSAANKTFFSSIMNDTQVVLSFGGNNTTSALAASGEAEKVDGKDVVVMTPDVDGTWRGEDVLSSVLKDLHGTVHLALDDLYTKEGATYFGEHSIVGIKEGMVGIPTGDSWRFDTFTEDKYADSIDTLKAVEGGVIVAIGAKGADGVVSHEKAVELLKLSDKTTIEMVSPAAE